MYRGCFHPFLDRSEQTGHSVLADHPIGPKMLKLIGVGLAPWSQKYRYSSTGICSLRAGPRGGCETDDWEELKSRISQLGLAISWLP
jgi:hypothetical protein